MKTKNNISTLIVTVRNQPGVLYKIAGLIRRRRFNIESLTVSHTDNPEISRFTILVRGERYIVEKMSKQLNKIIEVLKVYQGADDDFIARELALIKVSTVKPGSRMEISTMAKHFRARVIDINPKNMTLEITGDENKIDAMYKNLKKYGILEFVRTGRTALFK